MGGRPADDRSCVTSGTRLEHAKPNRAQNGLNTCITNGAAGWAGGTLLLKRDDKDPKSRHFELGGSVAHKNSTRHIGVRGEEHKLAEKRKLGDAVFIQRSLLFPKFIWVGNHAEDAADQGEYAFRTGHIPADRAEPQLPTAATRKSARACGGTVRKDGCRRKAPQQAVLASQHIRTCSNMTYTMNAAAANCATAVHLVAGASARMASIAGGCDSPGAVGAWALRSPLSAPPLRCVSLKITVSSYY